MGNQGPWSPSFQAGTNAAPSQIAYSTAQLLKSARIRAALPKSSRKTFSDDDLLLMATEEMRSIIVPRIIELRKDFYNGFTDFNSAIKDPTDPRGWTYGPFPMPYRAIGSDPKCIYLINVTGDPVELPAIQEEDLPYQGYGFYLRNNNISFLLSTGNFSGSIRVSYFCRPNQLVTVDRVGFVQGFTATTIALTNIPLAFTTALNTYDIIKSGPSFDTRAYDLAATLTGSTLTFPAGTLPADLAVGDQVSISDESAIVQLPVEFHPALAEALAARVLRSLGDAKGYSESKQAAGELLDTGLGLVKNRVAGNPQTILAVNGPYRRGGW
jgi:hypothetical protein